MGFFDYFRRSKQKQPQRPIGRPSFSSVLPAQPSRPSDDGCFGTSLLVAHTTDNAGLGYLVGGNLTGALVGDMLRDSGGGGDSGRSCDSLASDYGSSSDSWSSSDSSSSCDSSSSSSSD